MDRLSRPSIFDTVPRFDPPVALRGYGAVYVGGAVSRIEAAHRDFTGRDGEPQTWTQSGHYLAGQLYAQIFLPAQSRSDRRIQFWHGGGLSGTQWERTPDGRRGWLQMALAEGFDTVVCDAAERGRSGIPHPEIVKEAPLFRSNEMAWHGFRIGPKNGYDPDLTQAVAYEGQRFPTGAFHAFASQFTARWPGFTRAVKSAYDDLLAQSETDNVIIAHSEGARYALEAALRAPKTVRAVVIVEPAGVPAMSEMRPDFRDIPVLALWGDYLARNKRWQSFHERFGCFVEDAGLTRCAQVDLNTVCGRGHSHFPMLDDGSEAVWALVSDWITGLEKADYKTTVSRRRTLT